MKTKLVRNLQFLFALTYASLLIAGAVPHQWLPRSWRPSMTKLARFEFGYLRMIPGMGVFNFSKERNPFQIISTCIQIEVRTKTGEIKVFKDFECPRQKDFYSLYQDPLRTFYINLASNGFWTTQRPSKPNLYVLATAEYFCRQYEGETAIIRFSTYLQNLENRVLMNRSSLPQTLDCNIPRSPDAPS